MASEIARALSRRKLTVWLDQHNLAGDRFSDEIPFRIIGAKAVIVLWSASSIASAWVRSEARQALILGKLLSFSLDQTLPPEPLDIVHCQRLDPTAKIGMFKGRWDALVAEVLQKVSTMKGGLDTSVGYAKFKSLASADLRATIDQAQSSRLRALEVERESFRVERNARAARAKAERGMSGHRTIENPDKTVTYAEIEGGPILGWSLNGYGVVSAASHDQYHQFLKGKIVGVSVFRYGHSARPPDLIAVSTVRRAGTIEFTGHGVTEDFEGRRFEGELVNTIPQGYGVSWARDGSIVLGKFAHSPDAKASQVVSPYVYISREGVVSQVG